MATINLLPWREHQRDLKRKQFIMSLLVVLFLTTLLVVFIYVYLMQLWAIQRQRNQQLDAEIVIVNKQLQTIAAIQSSKHAILHSMNFIQKLQLARPLNILLFDELSKKIPDGVYLERLEKDANKIQVLGYAATNTAVSQLMRNMESSHWIQQLELVELKVGPSGSMHHKELAFSLRFTLQEGASP